MAADVSWPWSLVAALVALAATGARAHAAGRLREFSIWATIPLVALLSLLFLPARTAGWFIVLPATIGSGLVVLLIVPLFPALSGRPRRGPRWTGAGAWIAMWAVVVPLVTH